jgi:NAD(P)-dependent dehydrogenase (short-subunit alcohol dehydrogenase family)
MTDSLSMPPLILLLGGSGYVGQAFAREIQRRNWQCHAIRRSELDYTRFGPLTRLLRDLKPAFVVNCAGFTGKPNVDACEAQQSDTLLGNVTLPLTIANACESAGIPWGHVSSGCIYAGARIRQPDGSLTVERDLTRPDLRRILETQPERILGFTEACPPNFSFRSPSPSSVSVTSACRWRSSSPAPGAKVVGSTSTQAKVDRPSQYLQRRPQLHQAHLRPSPFGLEQLPRLKRSGRLSSRHDPPTSATDSRERRRRGAHAAQQESRARHFLHRQDRQAIAPHLRPGVLVVLESTTYPGTTDEDCAEVLEAGLRLEGGHRLPPRLLTRARGPRQSRSSVATIPKVVGGLHARLPRKGQALYGRPSRRSCRSPPAAPPRPPSCSRTSSAPSTSPSSTSSRSSTTPWASTSGRSSTPPRPSPSASCRSIPAPASAATASRSTRSTSPGRPASTASTRASSSWPARSTPMPDHVVNRVAKP